VVIHDAFDACDSGQHGFGAATKAGKDMRLDKAGEDLEIRFHKGAVHKHAMPLRRTPQVHQVRRIPCVVVHDPVVIHDFRSQHLNEFLTRVSHMSARAIDEHDLLPGHDLFQFLEQHRQHATVRHGPGDIAKDNRDPVPWLDRAGERCRAHGVSQGRT